MKNESHLTLESLNKKIKTKLSMVRDEESLTRYLRELFEE